MLFRNDDDNALWENLAQLLDSVNDLEAALLKVSEKPEKSIIDVTHNFILSHENRIIDEVFSVLGSD